MCDERFVKPADLADYRTISLAVTVRDLRAGEMDLSKLPLEEMRKAFEAGDPSEFFAVWSDEAFKPFRNGMAAIALEERWAQTVDLTQSGTLFEQGGAFQLVAQAIDETDTSEVRMNKAARSARAVINHVLVHSWARD